MRWRHPARTEETVLARRARHSGPRTWTIATIIIAVFLAVAATAGAATQNRSQTVDFKDSKQASIIDTGAITPQGGGICDECIPDALSPLDGATGLGGRLQGGLEVEWVNPVKYDMTYTDSLVRQGETLDMKDVVSTQTGKVKVSAFVSGFVGIYQRDPDVGSQPWVLNEPLINETKKIELGTFDCTIPLPGESPRRCSIGEKEVTVFEISFYGVIDLDVRIKGELFFDADGTPIGSLRILTTAGGTEGGLQKELSFAPTSPVTLEDPMKVPCTEPAGNDVFYKLTSNDYSASTKFTAKVSVLLVIDAPAGPWGSGDIDFTLWSEEFDNEDFGVAIPRLDLAAPDVVENLGPLKPDNRPPVLANISSPDGDEGSQISFHVDATDNCGPPAVRWDFSDGGVAFGTDPKHTFADNGHYTGLITATDDTGNVTRKTFALDIANLKPSVNAGPDTTSDWGRIVQFNGQATDPGAGDQPTLQYTWAFGDGTPSATGGPSVGHAYASPSSYTATLTVCDKNGACDSDTRQVVVTKRDTSIGYLGDTSGTYDTPATLSASLVDEYGQTVNGRSVAFSVGADGPLSALTNSSGIATKSYVPTLAAGAYTGASSFGGDALYNSSSSSNGFGVAKKATTTTYTGATTGGPNKTIVLSAVLKDATGKPLAGKVIAFALGTQSATATTNASGIASANLKLTLKNGTYTVSATYTPSTGDDPYYIGSSQGVTFKLQTK
ncbi:MAG TPA: PKD domain-containing protein [Gaiellaceae bacterium]|jgi:hypothetical protein|nr:PKD domain-containing protein [Gaiellaceae bacterium]